MNLEIAAGRALEVTGWLFQFWGKITGDELRRLRGYQLVAVGQMRVLGGQAAGLLRYCTPRQALAVQPALVRNVARNPGRR
jgi:uncharacterized protein YjbJ (UPF0337 family)